jgi:zinc protease
MYQDVPEGFGAAWDVLMDVAFTRHRYRRSLIGTEETLRDTPRESILEYFRKGYVPANMVYAIAGAVSADAAFDVIERHFGDMPATPSGLSRPEPEPRQDEFRFVEVESDVEQGYFKMGFHIPPDEHVDAPAVQVLGHLLGSGRSSRLYRELLEERGLVSSISVLDEAGIDPGILVVDAITEPDRVGEAVAAVYGEIAWFHRNLVSEDALEKSLNNVMVGFVSGLETVEGQTAIAGRFETFGDYRRAAKYPERIAAVTAADVQRVARRYLRFDGSTVLFNLPGENREPSRVREDEIRDWLVDAIGEAAIAPPADDVVAATPANRRPPETTTNGGEHSGEIELGALSNGSPLLVRRTGKVPLVALAVYGRAGSRYEPEHQVGIGTLCSRAMLKGTTRRTNQEIADEVERYGISLVPFNDRDVIGFYIESLTTEFDRALDLFAEVITDAAYPEAEVQRERELQLADLAMEQDDTFTVTIRRLSREMMNDHPYGRNSLGTPETIAAIGRDDLLAWHRRFFVPANLSFAAVGDLDLAGAKTALDDRLGALAVGVKPTAPNAVFNPKAVTDPIVINRDKAQSIIVTGMPAPARDHESRYAHQVLHRILDGMGERLFIAIREERQLCYFTGAFLTSLDDAGMFGGYVGTSPDRVDEALGALWEEFEKFRDEGPTVEELERAKQVMMGSYLISLQRSGSQASAFARTMALGFGHERVLEYPERVREVTREDVLAAARATIDRARSVTVILRPDGSEA